MIHIASPNTKSKFDTDFEEECIQPNAYDLRLDKVFGFPETVTSESRGYYRKENVFKIDEENKEHREFNEIAPGFDGYFYLDVGTYQITMKEIVEIGEGEAGFVITRSTLNRNGVYLTSGLYDSGYHGVMAGAMHVTTGRMVIKPGTRVGQFLLFKAETLNMYNGSYGIGKEYDGQYK